MNGLSGLIVTPMWREFMDVALAKLPDEKFAQPQINLEGVKPIIRGDYIDASQVLESMATSNTETVNLESIYGNIHSILHFVDRSNPLGPNPSNPYQDPQYKNWEYAVNKWKEETFGALIETQTSVEDTDSSNEPESNRSRRNRDTEETE
jgi:membrane carboxypeptidase/penicillin-binding protein